MSDASPRPWRLTGQTIRDAARKSLRIMHPPLSNPS